MSFCLAFGSPALITYSLTTTILNRYWVRQQFHGLIIRAQEISRGVAYGERIKCALYLLSEEQQIPLRATQDQGWLSSLIVIPENQHCWLDLMQCPLARNSLSTRSSTSLKIILMESS